jgi:myo-inositol catabolism protein IolC
MTPSGDWRPSAAEPLLILAMDHRESFGRTLFGVRDDRPDRGQRAAMQAAKRLIYAGLVQARGRLPCGRPGVLVDERYGQAVIDQARSDGTILAIPVERSGRDWFELEWGRDWLEHVGSICPQFAKVLIRDNPDFPAPRREQQFGLLRQVSDGLARLGVPLLYELLVPATSGQLGVAGGTPGGYDRDIRPGLVTQVIADNQAAGVEPAIWKVEGLETTEAARAVVAQMRSGGRDGVRAIVLGRDAPADRLDHWLAVAAPVDGFVGFAIGRSIWEDPISDHNQGRATDEQAISRIAGRYLDFARQYCAASGAVRPGTLPRLRDDPSGSGEQPGRHQAEDEAADVGEEGHSAPRWQWR